MEPASLLAGGLIALLFAIPFFNDDDDSDEPATPALDPENGTVTGTEGADNIDLVAVNDEETDPEVDYDIVYGREGDDTLSALAGGSVYGDDGDDIIEFDQARGDTLDGGAGDDVLTGTASGAEVLGGTGNDTVNITWGTDDQDEGVTIDLGDGDDLVVFDGPVGIDYIIRGGAGDDTFRIMDASANPNISSIAPLFYGSEGDDVYEFTLRPDENAVIPEDPGFTGYAHFGSVYNTPEGFQSGSDRLVVDPYSLAGDATFVGYEEIVAGGTGFQEIVFHYTNPDYPDGLAMSFAVMGTGRITLDDVEIVGGPAIPYAANEAVAPTAEAAQA